MCNGNRRIKTRALAWLSAAFIVLAASGDAKAGEWVRLHDSSVWSDVGALYNFRLALSTSDNTEMHTYVIDCRTSAALPLATSENGVEELLAGEWFDVKPNTVGEEVSNYACARPFEKRLESKWLADPSDGRVKRQSNQVGEHINFRLTYIDPRGSDLAEIWAVDCKKKVWRVIDEVAAGDNDNLIDDFWRSADDEGGTAVQFACGTYRG